MIFTVRVILQAGHSPTPLTARYLHSVSDRFMTLAYHSRSLLHGLVMAGANVGYQIVVSHDWSNARHTGIGRCILEFNRMGWGHCYLLTSVHTMFRMLALLWKQTLSYRVLHQGFFAFAEFTIRGVATAGRLIVPKV